MLSSLLIGGLLLAPIAGCGTTATRSTLQYSDRARREYEVALQLFTGEEWTDAQEAFQRVKREFGVSRWGWLAELRLADIDFRTEKFAEAVGAYRSWIRYHPGQPEVTYARFMIAKAHFQQIPQDWALVPSAWERDLGSAQDAQDALRNFIRDYGQSEYAAEARSLLRQARAVMARGEIHVAEYYQHRSQNEAAIARFRTVLETFTGSGLEAEALLKLGELYLSMGREREAREAFTSLTEHFGTSEYVPTARRYIQFLSTVRR